MATDTIAVAALGRPFTLGMLYDSRQDKLIPGFTLWDDKTLQANAVDNPQRSSTFEITASDSIEEKSNLLNVEASLKASFLSGLVEVGGSAKYLTDQKKFQNQSRVTLQYKATTKFKQLSMVHLGAKNMQFPEVFEKQLATHVVTGILYGANAFFVFDSDKSEASSVEDIQGDMEVVIKKIPSVEIEGKASFQLTDEEKALTNNFSCKFHGDFHLESNPTTFEDAVKTYQQLPKLLGENGENAVPLKVWLTPLSNLDAKAAQIINELSIGLVIKAQKALEELNEMEMRCNDSLDDKVTKHFPDIYEELINFKKMCKDYTFTLRQTMAKKLPSIRGGKEDESVLIKVFQDRDKSPFSKTNLSKWMDCAERKINVLSSCVDTIEGTKTKIVKNRRELDREIFDPQVQHVICFVFTSLGGPDPYLRVLADYLESPSIKDVKPPAQDQWYFSYDVTAKMRKKAKTFRDFAKAMKSNKSVSFLIAAIANEKYKGATIYHYKDCSPITDDFSRPDVPPVETITDKGDILWYACDLTMDPNTVHNLLELSDDNKMVTFKGNHSYPNHPDRFEDYKQVLCREGLTGRYYWEVEWSGFVIVAVTYKSIPRKKVNSAHCLLASSDKAWSMMHWNDGKRGDIFTAYHKGQESSFTEDTSGCRRLGVYLDWHAGTLSFYQVSSNTLSHLYTFRTKFKETVYPAFNVMLPSCYLTLSEFM